MSSPWVKILSAPSSRKALEFASEYQPEHLSAIPFPLSVDRLSKPAKENAHVIHRGLGVKIPGIDVTGWELWTDEEDEEKEHYFNRTPEPLEVSEAPQKFKKVSDGTSIDISELSTETLQHNANQTTTSIPKQATSRTVHHDLNKPNSIISKPEQSSPSVKLSSEDITHAKAVQSWAHISPHLSPPSDSLTYLRNSPVFELLLKYSLSNPSTSSSSFSQLTSKITVQLPSPSTLAALLTALTDYVPPQSTAVFTNIICPYLKSLTSPASRDMLTAILHFTARHWRHTVPYMFVPFVSSSSSVAIISSKRTNDTQHTSSEASEASATLNSAVGEILSRVAEQSLPPSSAKEALFAFCSSTCTSWSDSTVLLVDTLLSRLSNKVKPKANPSNTPSIAGNPSLQTMHETPDNEQTKSGGATNEVIATVISGMERNMNGLEKSVRFGKLLFTLVKDMSPELRLSHQASVTAICKNSKQFLAKRALKLLEQSTNTKN